jgi:hypothetical protein
MDCRDCARYDNEEAKCRDGKVNPPRYDLAITVAQVLGVRSICIFNDHRERILGVRSRPSAPHSLEVADPIRPSNPDKS